MANVKDINLNERVKELFENISTELLTNVERELLISELIRRDIGYIDEKVRYVIQDSEAGNEIERFITENEARNKILEFEKEDKLNNEYVENFYEIKKVRRV